MPQFGHKHGGHPVRSADAKLEDRHVPVWEAILRRVRNGSMPPKGMPQPAGTDRQRMVEWVTQALEGSRSPPAPKNGVIRRLTIAQYRNTLRELLLLDDDLTGGPSARRGFPRRIPNNKDTLQLSPLLTESYFEIAERHSTDPSSIRSRSP